MDTQSSLINDVLENKNCILVRNAHNRRVFYHKNGHYVKVFELSGWASFFLLIKIRREIKKHLFLKNKGLALPALIGFEKRKDNFSIITREMKGIVLSEYFNKKLNDSKRADFLKSLSLFLCDNYKKGFFHKDLHFGNIIWNEQEENFYFLDPKEIVYRRKISYRKRIKNFALLYNSLLINRDSFFSNNWDLLADQFFEVSGLKKYGGLLEKYRRKNFSSWLVKRTKRCFKVNRDFVFFKKQNYSGYYFNPVMKNLNVAGTQTVDFCLDIFKSEQTEYLKNSNTTAVARLKRNGVDLAVKRFNVKRRYDPYKNFFRRSRAYRSWYWGWRLNLLNIPVPEPVFFFEKRVMGLLFESYYAMNFERHSLNAMEYLNTHSDELVNDKLRKKLFLQELARFVVKCNNALMLHRDFQLKNILVKVDVINPGFYEYSFKLIDLEAIKPFFLFYSKIIYRHLFQLKKSFLRLKYRDIFSIKEILFFLRIVLENDRWDKKKIRRLLEIK